MTVTRSDMTILGDDALFVDRVRASLVLYCQGTVIGEAASTAYHDKRNAFAIAVLNSPNSFKQRVAYSVATDSNVIGDATTGGTVALDTGNVDTEQANVADTHLDSAVSSMFNSFFNLS
jgi:hypothetical protein